jgi:hypothetical protein
MFATDQDLTRLMDMIMVVIGVGMIMGVEQGLMGVVVGMVF